MHILFKMRQNTLRHVSQKDLKKVSKERERITKRVQNKEAVDILMQEVGRSILELDAEFSKTGDTDNEELLRRKEDHPTISFGSH